MPVNICYICMLPCPLILSSSDRVANVAKLEFIGEISIRREERKRIFVCKRCCINLNSAIELKNKIKKNHSERKQQFGIEKELAATKIIKKELVSDHEGLDDTTDEECCEKMQETSQITVPVPKEKVHFQCEHCNFKSSWKIALKFHLTTHQKIETKVKCAICLKWADDINSFKLHQCNHLWLTNQIQETSESSKVRSNSYHATLQKFTCQKCPAMYTSQRNLNRHIATHKEPNYKPSSVNFSSLPLKCTKCPKTFMKKHVLNLHIRTVHGNTSRFFCFCNKSFARASSLTKHSKTHK